MDKSKLEARSEDDIDWFLSGSMIEHYLHGYIGGPVKLMEGLANGVGSLVVGDLSGLSVKEPPVLRRFYASEVSDWVTTKRFYDLRKRTLIANEYVKNLKKNKNPDVSRQGMLANKSLLAAKKFVDAADSLRKRIKRKEYDIKKSSLSEEDKRHKLEFFRQQTVRATRQALAKARELGLDV